jgi:hypothetical protein
VTQGSLLLASPQQGVPPNRSIQQGTRDSQLHLRQTLAALALSRTYLGPREWSLRVVTRNVSGWYQGFLPSQAKELACEGVD